MYRICFQLLGWSGGGVADYYNDPNASDGNVSVGETLYDTGSEVHGKQMVTDKTELT